MLQRGGGPPRAAPRSGGRGHSTPGRPARMHGPEQSHSPPSPPTRIAGEDSGDGGLSEPEGRGQRAARALGPVAPQRRIPPRVLQPTNTQGTSHMLSGGAGHTGAVLTRPHSPPGSPLAHYRPPPPPPHHKEPGDMDTHRRRINTEEKAKVVAAVWGTDFFIFLMAIHVGNTSSRKITEVKQQSKKRQKNPCRPNSFPLGRFEE